MPSAFQTNHEASKHLTDENKPMLSLFLLPELLQRSNSNEFSQTKTVNDSGLFSSENLLKMNQDGSFDELKGAKSFSTSSSSSKVVKPHVCTSCQKRFARLTLISVFFIKDLKKFIKFYII